MYASGVEQSPIGHCMEIEPSSMLSAQIITFTCQVVLENVLNQKSMTW